MVTGVLVKSLEELGIEEPPIRVGPYAHPWESDDFPYKAWELVEGRWVEILIKPHIPAAYIWPTEEPADGGDYFASRLLTEDWVNELENGRNS